MINSHRLTITDSASIFPLTLNQERVVISREMARLNAIDAPPALIRIGFSLRGDLEVGALRQVLLQIVQRHSGLRVHFSKSPWFSPSEREESLRTFARTGICESGYYVQTVVNPSHIEFTTLDIANQDDVQQLESLQTLTNQQALVAFAASEATRLRATLLKTGNRDHLLLVYVDRLVCDGRSIPILQREFRNRYTALVTAARATPELKPTSFPEFASWQCKNLNTPYFTKALRYWRRQWATFAPARISFRHLPQATTSLQTPGFVFGTARARLTTAESEELRLFARNRKTTLYIVFLSALAIVLAECTGKKTVAIWGHFSNRTCPETLDSVGNYSNTHLLGIDLAANPSVEDLLRQVRRVVIGAFAHQELPLAHLWQTLGCAPRFHDAAILIDYIPATEASERERDLPLQIENAPLPDSSSPRFSTLGVYITDHRSGLAITIKYSRARFQPEFIQQFIGQMRAVLSRFSHDPTATALPQRNGANRPTGKDNEMNEFIVWKNELILSEE